VRILGIHDGHNASACLLVDGRLEWCIQEERLTGTKNFWGFPKLSLAKVLQLAGLRPSDIDRVAMAGLHMPQPADVLKRYQSQTSLRSQILDWAAKTPIYTLYKGRVAEQRKRNLKEAGFESNRVSFVEHHLCHASAAYFGSPFRDGSVLVFTSDGSGDGLCGTVSVGEKGSLRRLSEIAKGNSIGNIYAQVTFMLGLVPWEHEWKVMGMAPYAPESGAEQSARAFRGYLRVPDGSLVLERSIPEPTHRIYPRLRRDLEFHRFDWISAGVQEMTERLLCAWVRNGIRQTGIKKIALAGGVFMNVKANKALMEMKEVEDIFVFPSCGDESNAIGAAYFVHVEESLRSGTEAKIPPLGPIYLGPSFVDSEVEEALLRRGQGLSSRRCDDIDGTVAELLGREKSWPGARGGWSLEHGPWGTDRSWPIHRISDRCVPST